MNRNDIIGMLHSLWRQYNNPGENQEKPDPKEICKAIDGAIGMLSTPLVLDEDAFGDEVEGVRQQFPEVGFAKVSRIAHHFYELGRRSRPKISDDSLEEEIAGMYQALFGTDVINRKERLYLDTFEAIARHFAQWGAEHAREQSKLKVSESLYDFMKKRSESLCFHDDFEIAAYKKGVVDGAKWQKEQMLRGLRSYCLDEMERFQGADEGSRAAREVYYDIIGYLDNYERR